MHSQELKLPAGRDHPAGSGSAGRCGLAGWQQQPGTRVSPASPAAGTGGAQGRPRNRTDLDGQLAAIHGVHKLEALQVSQAGGRRVGVQNMPLQGALFPPPGSAPHRFRHEARQRPIRPLARPHADVVERNARVGKLALACSRRGQSGGGGGALTMATPLWHAAQPSTAFPSCTCVVIGQQGAAHLAVQARCQPAAVQQAPPAWCAAWRVAVAASASAGRRRQKVSWGGALAG